jgi:hypothetical protein
MVAHGGIYNRIMAGARTVYRVIHDWVVARAGPMHRTGDRRLVMVALAVNTDRLLAGVVILCAGVLMVLAVNALRLCAGGDEDDQPCGKSRCDLGFKL